MTKLDWAAIGGIGLGLVILGVGVWGRMEDQAANCEQFCRAQLMITTLNPYVSYGMCYCSLDDGEVKRIKRMRK